MCLGGVREKYDIYQFQRNGTGHLAAARVSKLFQHPPPGSSISVLIQCAATVYIHRACIVPGSPFIKIYDDIFQSTINNHTGGKYKEQYPNSAAIYPVALSTPFPTSPAASPSNSKAASKPRYHQASFPSRISTSSLPAQSASQVMSNPLSRS